MKWKNREPGPVAGASARAASAHAACMLLVAAYERGAAREGSVDWDDLNIAWDEARNALSAREIRRIRRDVQARYGKER